MSQLWSPQVVPCQVELDSIRFIYLIILVATFHVPL